LESQACVGISTRPRTNPANTSLELNRSGLKNVSLSRVSIFAEYFGIVTKFAMIRLWPNLKAAVANAFEMRGSNWSS